MQIFDLAIVGGALVGSSFALALGDTDLTVALIEPHAPRAPQSMEDWDSRVYALSPGNADWLQKLGIWSRLPEERLTAVERMRIFGDQARGRLEFSAYDSGLSELAWIIENGLLQRALWEALQNSQQVRVFCPARPAEVAWERDVARLTLDDGSEIAARLIVGADGAESWVRERAGIASTVEDYEQIGVVANFAAERPHDGTAFQWFRADGVLALLPLPGSRVSMVWSAPEEWADELLGRSRAALEREVEHASAGALGALQLITPAAGFPLRRQRVGRLVEPRVALIGDAAHNVHPLAGQGVNLGLRDARELARVLLRRGAQKDCGEYGLLRRYERARREDIAALELTTHGLKKLFESSAVSMAALRNIGLALVDRQPLVKTALIRRAIA